MTAITKTCKDCAQVKSLDQLVKAARSTYGVRAWCLDCNAAYQRRRRDTPTVHTARMRKARREAAAAVSLRLCSLCQVDKPHSAFTRDASKVDGLRTSCRDCANERRRAQYRADPVKYIAAVADRRARKYAATLGPVDYPKILSASACYLCGDQLSLLGGSVDVDHVIPLTRGGAHATDNLLATHATCNRRKRDQLLSELHWYTGATDLGKAR